jgi:hypothetical protein
MGGVTAWEGPPWNTVHTLLSTQACISQYDFSIQCAQQICTQQPSDSRGCLRHLQSSIRLPVDEVLCFVS